MEVQTDILLDEGQSLSFEQSTLMDIPRRHLTSTTSMHGPVFIPPNGAPPSPSLFRVGSTGHTQQFQFVPPPPPSGAPGSSTIGGVPPSPIGNRGSRSNRLSSSDRRQSIESGISSLDARPAGLLNSTDKSRPPMMVLPPPPKAPPPPNSMPPPNFIPDRRGLSSSSLTAGVPPPRPSSPPPAELIQRATTPTFGSVLNVPGVSKNLGTPGNGAFGSVRSVATNAGSVRQLPSTSSFKSGGQQVGTVGNVTIERRQFSATTTSLALSERSPRSSISSSEHGHAGALLARNASVRSNTQLQQQQHQHQQLPSTPGKMSSRTTGMSMMGGGVGGGTDPAIIHAITQTMIGEFMYKYTRKAIGKGHGERRHRRFFWVHPYTKTLYWSSSDPGSSNVNESSAKSAYIEGVRSVMDPNPMPPGLYQYSVVVSTPQREMKITAPTKERHDIWLNALKYLLSRPSPNVNAVDESPSGLQSPDYLTDDDREPPRRQRLQSSPQSFRSSRRGTPGDTWNTTPRGKRSRSQLSVNKAGSVSKRSGTPALEYLRWNGPPPPESPYSPTKSFVDVDEHQQRQLAMDDEEDLDFELHEETMSDGGFEGLENVRACCDGRHTVGHSGRHHHHHHHHPQQQQAPPSHPISQFQTQGHAHTAPLMGSLRRGSTEHAHLESSAMERPASPAWSLRSKADSLKSHEGGGGLFSWARGEGSKLRFGTKRSAKSSVGPSADQ
ncbi:hypothetical protein NP233_g7047 [Leucocoprinus birnbaumii]|uniref:PH domain-containing protein n=1 Tax=Leucocoprinus birnbaumii TaxID=56174 RepID=A0AAD5YPG7_9AGAR|nr:hypothetical protein NP233_g7047 [Leucocoprinus birnbaumii]